jgi:hypothetical protein
MFGFEEGSGLIKDHMYMCTTPLQDEKYMRKYADKFVLVDGFSADDVGLANGYGYKKAVSLLELMALYPSVSPVAMKDFFMSKERLQKAKEAVLARFGLSEDELKKQLKFSAVIIFCSTFRVCSFAQIICDIVGS